MIPRNGFRKPMYESIPRTNSSRLCSMAGRYDNPNPTWFLAPIDCLKFQLWCAPSGHNPRVMNTNDWYKKAHWVNLVQHFVYRGISHQRKGATSHIIIMICLYRSHISVKGGIVLFQIKTPCLHLENFWWDLMNKLKIIGKKSGRKYNQKNKCEVVILAFFMIIFHILYQQMFKPTFLSFENFAPNMN